MGLGLNLGFGVIGAVGNGAKTIAGGIIDKTADNFIDGFGEDYLNLSSPDGVQSYIEAQNAASHNTNSVLSAYATSSDAPPPATADDSNENTENVPAAYGSLLYQQDVDSVKYTVSDKEVTAGPRPYSVFNKYSLVNFRGTPLNDQGSPGNSKSDLYNKVDELAMSNPTASKIIEITNGDGSNKNKNNTNVGYTYNYSDFALTRYYGKIPNNMMITLRRFAFPTDDDIISPKSLEGESIPQPDLARAVTWMGGPTGNDISEILKFSHGFNWKEASAQVQTLNSQQGARSGEVGQLINANRFLSAASSVAGGENAVDRAVREANAGFDAFSNTYPNHVFGPLNVIKDVLVREQGLTFDNEFTLKFEYELRDLGGANPKILFLDQLSNLLTLTYNNAPFWGGDVRYIGDGSITRPLGNIEKIRQGDYKGFLTSVVDGFKSGTGGALMDDIKNIFQGGDSKILKNMIGGSLMKMFNSPQGGQAVNSLLTGDPTGQWHLTVGNPLNPIMVIGNLACTKTEISFEGDIGPYDFPERLVATVSLKPGRPRDKSGIESMFNAGRGRFYLQPNDGVDVNRTFNVSAYGNKDRSKYESTFRKISNG